MTSPKISIVLDNPTSSFFPGQLISGRVVIKTKSEKTAQGLLLKLKGTTSTHWTEEKTESSGFRKCKLVREVNKTYEDTDIFYEFKNYILGNGQNEVIIPVGESAIPFYIQVPTKNMPSSYLGPYGKVEYVLEANLKRPKWKSVMTAKKNITVNAIVDLNASWEMLEPITYKVPKRFGPLLLSSWKVRMDVDLKCRAFCPGEFIPVEVDIKNKSDRKVRELSAEVVQETVFHARNKITDTNKRKTLITISYSKLEDGGVNTGDSKVWRTELQIPPVPPTQLGGGCKLIEVQYFLLITAHFTDPKLNVTQKCPLKIATIPLRSKFEELGAFEAEIVGPRSNSILSVPNGYYVIPPILYQNSFNFKLLPLPNSRGAGGDGDSKATKELSTTTTTTSAEREFIPNYVTYQGRSNYGPKRPIRIKRGSVCSCRGSGGTSSGSSSGENSVN